MGEWLLSRGDRRLVARPKSPGVWTFIEGHVGEFRLRPIRGPKRPKERSPGFSPGLNGSKLRPVWDGSSSQGLAQVSILGTAVWTSGGRSLQGGLCPKGATGLQPRVSTLGTLKKRLALKGREATGRVRERKCWNPNFTLLARSICRPFFRARRSGSVDTTVEPLGSAL